jgi:hypothetical protein
VLVPRIELIVLPSGRPGGESCIRLQTLCYESYTEYINAHCTQSEVFSVLNVTLQILTSLHERVSIPWDWGLKEVRIFCTVRRKRPALAAVVSLLYFYFHSPLFCFISSIILCIIGSIYLEFFLKKRYVVEEIYECHFRMNKCLSPTEFSLHRTTVYYV